MDESHIITNKHVVRRLAGYRMQIVAPVFGGAPESSTWQQLRLFEHPDLDVAVIHLETPGDRGLTPLPGMVFRDPAWADEVYVLGYPRVSWMVDTGITLQRGEVVKPLAEVPRIREADADPWDTPSRTKMFLYSAIARPGNSGGPIVAHDGRVIGIVVEDSSLTSSSGEKSADKCDESESASTLPDPAPFYRGIPASEIRRALEHFDLGHLMVFEDPLNL